LVAWGGEARNCSGRAELRASRNPLFGKSLETKGARGVCMVAGVELARPYQSPTGPGCALNAAARDAADGLVIGSTFHSRSVLVELGV
jgi:hypothetical protein